jgi:alpha-tubulin suppressor-like RCC1 family protein
VRAHRQIGQCQHTPRLVSALKGLNVVEVVAGHMHSLCVDADGKVYSFGYGRFHQLGRNSDRCESHSSVLPVPLVWRTFGVAAIMPADRWAPCDRRWLLARSHCCVSADGALLSGCVHRNGCSDQHEPMHVEGIHGVRRVACGGQHNLAVNSAGRLLTWGAAQNGSLGLVRRWAGPAGCNDATSVRGSFQHDLSRGRRRIWGFGHTQGLNDNGCREPTVIEVEMDVAQVACGWKHSAAVTTSGRLLTWGWGGSMGTQMYVSLSRVRMLSFIVFLRLQRTRVVESA